MTPKSKCAVFAGSFDPFTIAHLDIVERGLKMFDHIIIAVGHNEHKASEAEVTERVDAIKKIFDDNPEVEVKNYSGLTAIFAKENGADILLRGVRNVADFEYERNLADVNRSINGIETVFIVSRPEYSHISSSMVRELLHNGYDASRFIAVRQDSGHYPQKI